MEVIHEIERLAAERLEELHSMTYEELTGYYHGFEGFRVSRRGEKSSLTQDDIYDLD